MGSISEAFAFGPASGGAETIGPGNIRAGRSDMETMEHVRVATYTITEGSFQDIAGSAKTGMLQKFKELPGFVRYGVADVGDRTLLSLSVWKSRQQAEAATPVAATWVRDNIADRIELKSNYIGDLAFFEGAPATV
jgi:hypothetical protein